MGKAARERRAARLQAEASEKRQAEELPATADTASPASSTKSGAIPSESVEPQLPTASYFELLEATPTSDPFHNALAEFIRVPDSTKTIALRALWDRARKLGQDGILSAGEVEGKSEYERGRDEGLAEGISKGRATGYEEARLAAIEEGHWRESTAYRKGHRAGWEAGKEKGTSMEKDCWMQDGHIREGRCFAQHGEHGDMAVQTDTLPETTRTSMGVQADPAISVSTTPQLMTTAPFNWADEADSIPIQSSDSLHTILTPPLPRDFSALRSGTAKPFGSLQRRYHARSQHRTGSYFRHQPPPFSRNQTTRTDTYHYDSKPFIQDSSLRSPQQLDSSWTKDPSCLGMLAQALHSLGWRPPRQRWTSVG